MPYGYYPASAPHRGFRPVLMASYTASASLLSFAVGRKQRKHAVESCLQFIMIALPLTCMITAAYLWFVEANIRYLSLIIGAGPAGLAVAPGHCFFIH